MSDLHIYNLINITDPFNSRLTWVIILLEVYKTIMLEFLKIQILIHPGDSIISLIPGLYFFFKKNCGMKMVEC